MVTKSNENTATPKIPSNIGPIDRFFACYQEFEYDPSKSTASEFRRLQRSCGWKRGDIESDNTWSAYRQALAKEFNALFGTDPEDLLAWQTLCMFIGVHQGLTTRELCIQQLRSHHYSTVDLIDARRCSTGAAKTFATHEELLDYMKRTGIFFPRGHPEAGGLLRHFFRDPQEPRGGYFQAKDKGVSDLRKNIKAKPKRETRAKMPSTSSDKKEWELRAKKKIRILSEALEFGLE